MVILILEDCVPFIMAKYLNSKVTSLNFIFLIVYSYLCCFNYAVFRKIIARHTSRVGREEHWHRFVVGKRHRATDEAGGVAPLAGL